MLGIIGGSGLYKMEGMEVLEEKAIHTPFGWPSDYLILGRIDGEEVWFLPRHGRGHTIPPTDIPHMANIWALKSVGVSKIIAVSAVGSLREDLPPGTLAVATGLIDKTRHRPESFFGRGLVAHVSMANPFCPALTSLVCATERGSGLKIGQIVCMEGPAFSTLGESHAHKKDGGDAIGMNASPEAKLAREAEMCFALLMMVTDFDCWHPSAGAVTAGEVEKVMRENVRKVGVIIRRAIAMMRNPEVPYACGCREALKGAIMTVPADIPAFGPDDKHGRSPRGQYRDKRRELGLLVGGYLPAIGEEGWEDE
ncbi:MTAP family purine nucleoside phosphorylase [Patescibacteria group bacterium]|nr:MTAP family purine nucleoside phosphorylase [Patescibacteria group bacterium]MBU1613049.1 MTAP family purine nucleoside phosphorylase [Patescibacteria group bacterium]